VNIRPERLKQSLEGTMAPVYLVSGSEPLLVQECRDLILEAARKNDFLERTVYQALAGFDWDILSSAGMEQSLFSSRKIIDIRMPTGKPGKDGGKKLSEWASHPDPDVLLIVSCDSWDASSRKARWTADLNKAGVQVEIWPVKPSELPAWIERRMRSAGLNPEREAVRLLADLVEGNLLAAQQEIDKLALLNADESITTALVRASVANSSRFDAFRLGECLLGGESSECLKVASGLQRTGVAIQMVGAALNFQLTQLSAVRAAVKQGVNEAQAFGRVRVFRMAQPLYRQALRRVSDRQLGDCFRALALLDRQGKGRAAGDPWQTLDRMLLMFCASPTQAENMPAPWT